jgi:uncharacterized protein (TIGR02466 family)
MVDENPSRFESAHALRMFPTFVWRAEAKPDVHRSISASIARKLGELRRSLPALEPGQSWRSDPTLHRLDAFRELVSCIDEAAAAVLAHLRIGYDAFEITACWAHVSAPGAGHGMVSHPNNYLSGVYCVQAPEGADTINFHEPRNQTFIIRPPVTELTAENTDQVVVKVADGTLLVFPSWLLHSVDANASGGERISVGFNIMFAAYAETMSRPLWEPG